MCRIRYLFFLAIGCFFVTMATAETRIKVYFTADPAIFVSGVFLEYPGHAWVRFEGVSEGETVNVAWGFYPTQDDKGMFVGGVPGEVRDEGTKTGAMYLETEITDPAVWERIKILRDDWNKGNAEMSPRKYSLAGATCVTFVDKVANLVGLRTPWYSVMRTPDDYIEALGEDNKDKAIYVPPKDRAHGFDTPKTIDDLKKSSKVSIRGTYNVLHNREMADYRARWAQYSASQAQAYKANIVRVEQARQEIMTKSLAKVRQVGAQQATINQTERDRAQSAIDAIRPYTPIQPIPGGGNSRPGSGSTDCGAFLCLDADVPGGRRRRIGNFSMTVPGESMVAHSTSGPERTETIDDLVQDCLRVSFAGAQSSLPRNTIALGVLPKGEKVELTVHVESACSGYFALFKTGDRLSAAWSSNGRQSGLPSNVAKMAKGEKQVIQLIFEAAEDAADLHSIMVHNGTRPILVLTLDYLLIPTSQITIPFRVKYLISGLGKAYSEPYRLCLGPAPYGFTLDEIRYDVEAHSMHSRKCGSWAECTETSRSDENVCVDYKIQGHDPGSCFGCGSDQSLSIDAWLTGIYRIKTPRPSLVYTDLQESPTLR